MCGLFGFSSYAKENIKGLSELTNALAVESAVRGTDATGVAFNKDGKLQILKEAKAAYNLDFKHSDKISVLIGHTRHSTHGSAKKVYNNHPFMGKTKNSRFALAHNGVLANHESLRKNLRLPKTMVETDSFVAVQLLESQNKLDFDSMKYMAEKLDGGFSFSVLDDKDNLYLIKGDSPLSILHFPKLKIYVYASTDQILYKAIVESPLFSALKNSEYEKVSANEGEILKIRPNGTLERDQFLYSDYYGSGWWEYRCSSSYTKNDYIEDLKAVSSYYGFSSETIDEMIEAGFTLDEIEDYLYCMDGEV